ncbi:MAG: Rieske 2Fe-2S domain-containing protein [Microbacter sp.]
MIRNQWYVVLESKEVQSSMLAVKRLNEALLFWRDESGKVVCFVDHCPHRGVALSSGTILHNHHIQCPFHGLEFDSRGRCTVIPANGFNAAVPSNFHVKRYATYEKYGFIWIFWGDESAVEGTPLFFDSLEQFYYKTRQDLWKTHYSRVIENQLDCAHIPFIHRKTIGRSHKTLVDGPLVTWKDEKQLIMYVFNRHDDGTPALKPEQLQAKSETEQHLAFIFPNLWQNYILPTMRVVVAFVPVDDETTIMYLRFYHQIVKNKLLQALIATLFMPYNIKIAHEDRRVVQTQRPFATALTMDENLFQADLPIVAYRKKRDQLMKLNR